jgi:hypothetical protein
MTAGPAPINDDSALCGLYVLIGGPANRTTGTNVTLKGFQASGMIAEST